MYKQFSNYYKPDNSTIDYEYDENKQSIRGWNELFAQYNGTSFNSGVYRLIKNIDTDKWSKIITTAFQDHHGRIIPFGVDWLGRFYCIDFDRVEDEQPLVLLFSILSNEVLEVPSTIIEFHNIVLVEQYEPALEQHLFNQFLAYKNLPNIRLEDCAAVSVPLYLGGELILSNIDIDNISVYWEISSRIFAQINSYPIGTTIEKVKLKEGASRKR